MASLLLYFIMFAQKKTTTTKTTTTTATHEKTNSNNIVSMLSFWNVIQPFFVNLTASLEDAPVQLNGFKAPHLFVSQGKLVSDISKFYQKIPHFQSKQ